MTHWHPTNTQDPATDGMGGNGKSGGVSSPFATLGSLRSATASSGSSNNNGIGAERGEARRGSTGADTLRENEVDGLDLRDSIEG